MFNATVTKRIDVTPELIRLFVRPDQQLARFQCGQYVAIGLPGSSPRPAHFPPEREPVQGDKFIKRAYSIASSPDEREQIELYIAVVPEGSLTSRLVLLKEGDRLFMNSKITGTFTLEGVEDSSRLVLVSTGTGLAPFISMIRTSEVWKPERAVVVVHGVRYPSDLGYRDELAALCSSERAIQYHPVVSRADHSWSGARGHVQSLFEGGTIALNPARDHVFLCGNPAMIDGMENALTARGFSVHSRKNPGNLHLEKYW